MTLSRTVVDDQVTTDFCFGFQKVLWPVYFEKNEVWMVHEVYQTYAGDYMCVACRANLNELIAMWDEEPRDIQ